MKSIAFALVFSEQHYVLRSSPLRDETVEYLLKWCGKNILAWAEPPNEGSKEGTLLEVVVDNVVFKTERTSFDEAVLFTKLFMDNGATSVILK